MTHTIPRRPNVVFATGGQIGTYTTEGVRTFLRSEAPRYFLVQLGHADISFALIVAERYVDIFHEAQHIVLVVTKPLQQVA
jgi:hypothetical protein